MKSAKSKNLEGDLAAIVGAEFVSSEPGETAAYGADRSYVPRKNPDAVVRPQTREQVRAVVRWANRTRTPLVPVSSAPPRFRGDTVPAAGGVVVDLSGMNKVLRVDRRNRVMVAEAGATFEDLAPLAEAAGLRMVGPLLPKAGKSILASVLEREPGIAPRYQWDVSDPLCCMEVVFGNGEFFRTGEAAGPGGLEAQWKIGGAQKFPCGPHQLDYHRLVQGAQGTMGVATWASIKCELLPSVSSLFFLCHDELAPLVSYAYKAVKRNVGEELFLANGKALAMMAAADADQAARFAHGFPSWVLVHVINGFERLPEERVAYQTADAADLAQDCGLALKKRVDGLGSASFLKRLRTPGAKPYWKHAAKGASQEIFFVTTMDRAHQYLPIVFNEASRAGYPASDIGVYLQPMVQGSSCHMEFVLPFDPEDERDAERVREVFFSVSRALLAAGAFFSRPYPAWAADVYRARSDAVIPLRRVKSVFDPNGVMNPGKLCF
ncbi:MAG: FAD-binding oxidoreductase [Deltaproteobacteria bacterium]|nr:FAD-binding oxidoreductase [Deltaproteobacteria bacterium]